ncbi:hypothetical protein [Actinomadura rupiterrae]|uniref:hypothetical protein n=1 Tax=Actinomadura rupiterrae TaxID=559627 RepID=UPI0020A4D004|nr:hypothetical protein [Actinomadura rupiterrae]MCP2335758.1 mannose-6-phosphate isomerase-like protein (cupin superfamily) [Actinomadura rupiterrae]
MGLVHEVIDAFDAAEPVRRVARREELLLGAPLPSPKRPPRAYRPIGAAHFPAHFVPQGFEPPKGIFESDFLRIERQTMAGFRQPFYHRNCDVDELSYQVYGTRTLMTELGSLDLVPGDFSRIPVTVAHDNHAHDDIHLLFYVPAHVAELRPAVRTSELVLPPFEGWKPEVRNLMTTECLGGPEHDIVMTPVDEQLLLEQADVEPERINVLRPSGEPGADGTHWLYRSARVRIGHTAIDRSDGREYRTHRDADDVQYQISGRRVLVTQLGVLELEPGDFVRIPVGVAFTSIVTEPSTHLTVLSALAVPQVTESTKTGQVLGVPDLDRLRAAG